MKLTKLSMANFRGFEHLELGFEKDINVIAGENGRGKSSILFALAIILSHIIRDFTVGNVKKQRFSDIDIRTHVNGSSNWLHVSGKFDLADVQLDFAIDRTRLTAEQLKAIKEEIVELELKLPDAEGGNKRDRDKEVRRIKRNIAAYQKVLKGGDEKPTLLIAGLDVPDTEIDSRASDKALRDFKSRLRKRPNQPIAVYYTTKRFFNDSFKSFPKLSPFLIQNAYSKALEDIDVSLKNCAHWFHFASRREKGARIVRSMSEVISEFIPEFKNLRLAEEGSIHFLVDKAGVTLPLTSLSDGERGIIAMVFDLTRRLSLANPSSEDPIGTGEAIVLIDEIELHLHPNWQRLVVGRLIDAFPKCQFIVTTHSPQVLGELEARKIVVLGSGEQHRPLRAFGLDSGQILEEIMDADPRNRQIRDKLRNLAIAVDKNDRPKVAKLLDFLKRQLGDTAPEVLEAETMLHFLEEK